MITAGNAPSIDIDLALIARSALARTEVGAEALPTVAVANVGLGRD